MGIMQSRSAKHLDTDTAMPLTLSTETARMETETKLSYIELFNISCMVSTSLYTARFLRN